MSPNEMNELVALRAENAKLKANKGSSIKVSAKGGVSVYGLGRWPVTLYLTQWEKLLDQVDAIRAFLEANRSLLKVKEQQSEAA